KKIVDRLKAEVKNSIIWQKKLFWLLSLYFFFVLPPNLHAQSCEEYISSVKSSGFGTTYFSSSSTAISRVTFYRVNLNYKTYYFAIVCFKSSLGCSEYIYQVDSNTELNYSINYTRSAGEAFWEYIHPYRNVLGCGPNI
ncbi:MAG: hypothetical protein ACK5XN_34685, partial [Bacteroidota bacterium]